MSRSFLIIFIALYGQSYAQLSAIKNAEGIAISDGKQPVLFYQVKPKSQNGKYERAGYVHPLYNLRGNIITEDFPEDHPHHHGIFWAWHQIMLNGKQIADGWTSDSISWRVEKVTTKKIAKSISIYAEVIWNAQVAPGKRADIIKENTVITVHELQQHQRSIDFDIKLTALVDSLQIGGSDDVKGYGGFSVRLKLPDDIQFISSDTIVSPQETAVMASRNMTMRGAFDGVSLPVSTVTVSVNGNKNNSSWPWILRSSGSMQNAVFPGRTPLALTRKGWRLQYTLTIAE